jgi:hypothetical protein
MTLEAFVNLLATNPNKSLLFEVAPQVYAGSHYHLTEIKTAKISSVDCGGQKHEWIETIFQLWENPKEIGKTAYLKTDKILDIVSKVNAVKALHAKTVLKIEYGNALFPTAQLNIRNVVASDQQLLVQLHSEQTKCKAPYLCGVPEPSSNSQTCAPGSGCC